MGLPKKSGLTPGKTLIEFKVTANKQQPLSMITKCFSLFLILVATASAFATEKSRFGDVICEGDYQQHLQGVCVTEDDSIVWSFTTQLVKTNSTGRVLVSIPVESHHGDLCFHRGKIYVAVNLGKFNHPNGEADSWVYVYDSKTLELTAKHETQEVFHGAGGVGVMNDRFYIVGGLPDGVQVNYVYEYDASFKFIKKHIIRSGWTRLGIQTATYHDNAWWFGCYGSPAVLVKADSNFKLIGRYEFDCSLGVVGTEKDLLLIAKGPRTKDGRWLGSLHPAHPDNENGLRLLPPTTPATNKEKVHREGKWSDERFRFAAFAAARTTEEKATLEHEFHGTGVSIRLGAHNTPAYGHPNLGALSVYINGNHLHCREDKP